MKTYRYGTTIYNVDALMRLVIASEGEQQVPVFRNKLGEPINRTTFSTILGRVKKDNYPDRTFYTYTDSYSRLIIGVRK